MSAFRTVVIREGDDMPKVIRVELPEGRRGVGWADLNLAANSKAAYERAWFEDFRSRWKRDLRQARVFTYQTVEVTA